jgi:hypothetical protein
MFGAMIIMMLMTKRDEASNKKKLAYPDLPSIFSKNEKHLSFLLRFKVVPLHLHNCHQGMRFERHCLKFELDGSAHLKISKVFGC